MAVLLLADHDKKTLNETTAKALTAAREINPKVHILVIGFECTKVAEMAAQLEGVELVLCADNALYAKPVAESEAALVVSVAKNYQAIMSAASSHGKNVLPRIAAKLDVMQISEITKVISPTSFERPIYAGNAIQTVESTDPVQIITVRASAFKANPSHNASAPINQVAPVPMQKTTSQVKHEEQSSNDRPELGAAKVVISGGRSLGSAENFKTYIEPIADKLGAAMGASRAAVDAGYVPNDWQVGQTGKIVAPDLYIAVGISGAIQHLAGMKESKVIVAINKDPEAPIFHVADYGIVGDLFTLLPELNQKL